MSDWNALLAASGLPRLEARALLEHVSARSRSWLIAHGDEAAPAEAATRFAALARRRREGEPLAYLLGFREFHGLRLRVSPAVLIPRADTELLVDLAIRLAPDGARMLDLGTGSGAIAVSLALERPDLRVLATDASAAALAVAARNAAALGAAQVEFRHGDWYSALSPDERFGLIVSNPPYIAHDDPHLAEGDLRHEPQAALTDGADGLEALRALVAGAAAHLDTDGLVGLEHGWTQGAAVRGLLMQAGFRKVRTLADDEGRERLTVGLGPADAAARR